MPEFRRGRSSLVVLVILSIGLLTFAYRQGPVGPLALIQRGAMTVVAPVQQGFATVVRPIGGFFVSVVRLGRLRAENQALKANLLQAEQRRVSVAEMGRENDELRGLLQMRDRFQLTTRTAEMIASPPGSLEWRMLVDVGADSGIKTGMAVINNDGLIGRIVEVTRSYSWVELATSPTAGYAARIAQNGESGALSGRGPEPFQLEVYDPEAELPADAEIVTQSYAGSRIPDGIPVGRVVSSPGGLAQGTRFVEVRPYVDFTALHTVLVVLNAPAPPATFSPHQIVTDPDPPRPPPFDDPGEAGAPALAVGGDKQGEAGAPADTPAGR